jgi:glycosyltransferase involved in cell wall biosynthesis
LVIPNSVAVDRYRRMEQSVARSQLGLDANAFVVLFGAYSLDKPWKGRAELAQSLEIWRQREPTKNACLATVGLGAMPTLACDLPIKPLGLMKSPEEMARVYSAADVVVVPSHIESFCLVTAEAASCGTPTVAFADTGVADIVRHSETGFLACTRDAGALANGISWASTLSSAARAQVGAQCRDVCVSRFSSEKVATAHIELYNQILADGGLLQ